MGSAWLVLPLITRLDISYKHW